MADLQKIRYLAANLPELQGLKAVPVGLLAFYVFIKEPGNCTMDILLLPALIALYAFMHRHYRKTFGWVEATKEYKQQYYRLSLAVMAVAVAGFAADAYFRPPISMVGLAFASIMLWTQAWMVRQAGGWDWTIFPGGWICIALVFCSAFLPLLGEETIGRLGFAAGLNLVGAAIGILYALYGVLEHFFLARSLPAPAEEAARR
ncbi:MAG: hypothetical protein JW929_02545 [Anaerolineales bacterium]|nr:hypothetical protein [Anaerolineales bacterium]